MDSPLPPNVRVTVIIPSYKAEATLGRAIRSCLNQTETNLEVLVVNDGSPDRTAEVAHAFAAGDPRVRVLNLPENKGKPYAMNVASAQARGDWIAILDADDWYAPTRLKVLIDKAEASNVDMVGDNIVKVDIGAKVSLGNIFPDLDRDRILTLDDYLEAADFRRNADYGMIQPIFRTRFIRDHGIRYHEPARFGEDFYVLLCYFVAGGKGLLVKDAFYYYEQPFGIVSRQWSHNERQRYNYELLRDIHRHFSEALKGKFTPHHAHLMDRRARSIEMWISFYQFKERLAEGNLKQALKVALKAPWGFWKMLLSRLMLRVYRAISPPRGTPIAIEG